MVHAVVKVHDLLHARLIRLPALGGDPLVALVQAGFVFAAGVRVGFLILLPAREKHF